MDELINILEGTHSPPEIIEMLNSVDQDSIQDYALSNGICPKCCCSVIIHTWKEEREYMGSIVFEEIGEWECQGCRAVY